jgi:hypothetical protein
MVGAVLSPLGISKCENELKYTMIQTRAKRPKLRYFADIQQKSAISSL